MSRRKIKKTKSKEPLFSKNEKKIAQLITEGKEVEEIMEELGLGIVETTQILSKLYTKIGGKNEVETIV